MPTLEQFTSSTKKIIFFGIGVFILILLVNGAYFTIQPGERGLIKTFGNISSDIYSDGIHFKIPFITTVVKMDIKVQKAEAEASSASKDLQNISTKIAVNYSLNEKFLVNIYKKVGKKEEVTRILIEPFIQEVVKATTAKFTAEELILKREEVSDNLKKLLIKGLEGHGVIVDRVSVTNFEFSKQFNEAIEAKVTAEQTALAEKNKLETIKYQAQQKVEQAKGEAEARITSAKAEAEAIKIQTEAIQSQGGAEYVKLKWIEKWDGMLPKMTNGGANLMNINVDELIK